MNSAANSGTETPLSSANGSETGSGILGVPVGIILPPPEIRDIIEKSAAYVARNGSAFEEKIRQNERSNPKFAFLDHQDPYFRYYQHRLDEVRKGNVQKSIKTASTTGTNLARPIVKPVSAAPPAPAPYLFSDPLPSISAQDLDVLKLTARYAAVRGTSFLSTISQREWRNNQFDFLRPNHALYGYFTRLVQQYTNLITRNVPSEKILQRNVEDRWSLLTRLQPRIRWQEYQETEKRKKKEKEEREKIEYAQIDWNDFVVVEVIEFSQADQTAPLALPTNLSDLQTATLEQKSAMFTMPDQNYTIEEAPPTAAPWEPVSAPKKAQVGVQLPAEYMKSTTPSQTEQRSVPQQHIPSVTVAPTSAPQAPRHLPRAFQRAVPMEKCPICGDMVPATELQEHIRIQLLDPHWREQRKVAESRKSTLDLSKVDVAANMKRLVSQRTDIFDVHNGVQVSEEERERRKRAATQSSWGAPSDKRR
ncbi:splicing factor Sap114 [Schizosaccharomyces japonicus yFS275]|uniref:Splicing factor Sap114 n=1 Tax=Schizosaccharomyces japonicus (strain yFS275 / FY16936) TaxID=402676 RepID=B6K6I5_SCHJY|nr:splicing factor Sap114 [Schizosaccharomyces japonicus yFS275]EEB09139.1 splicing factor Sap114 [Schizosaccharomyces japonicus yFS275]